MAESNVENPLHEGEQLAMNRDEDMESTTNEEAESTVDAEDVKIVFAGKSGAGKTSLCKTLLGLEKDIPLTPRPDTEVAEPHETMKNGIKITIIDTPGFVNKEVKYAQNKFDVLVYCIPVDPSCKFKDANPDIMRRLQDIYGKDIWKHCVVAFTFSNVALERSKKKGHNSIEQYKQYIEEYTKLFQEELRQLHVANITAKGPHHQPDQNIITAIPAGDTPEDPVLLGVEDLEWVDEIFLAMIAKCKCNEKLAEYRYGKEFAKKVLINIGAGAVGAGTVASATIAGTAAGASLGVVGGPVGIVVVSILGGLAGLAIGSGASVAAMKKFRKSLKKKQ